MFDLYDLKVVIFALGGTLLLLFGLISLIYVPVYFAEKKYCYTAWSSGPYDVDHSFWGGCRILTEEGYIPARSFRYNLEDK